MKPLSIRCFLPFLTFLSIGVSVHAQILHFSDFQSLYPADSASLRNFCEANGLTREAIHEYDRSYSITFYSDGNKRQLSRAFGKDPADSARTSYVMNYFFGADKKQYKLLKKEVKKAGYTFKESQPIALPHDYNVEKDIYTNDRYGAYLEIHKKEGKFFAYEFSYCPLLKKQQEKSIYGQAQDTANAASFKGAVTPNGFSLKRGINVSYGLSQVSNHHPIKYVEHDAAYLAALGFDNVRLPVDEKELWDEAGKFIDSNWTILYSNIDISLKHHLKAVIDLHIVRSHYFNAANEGGGKGNTLFSDTAAQTRFFELWRELSSRLGHYPNDQVAYEIMNEPVANDPQEWNDVLNKAYAVIRKQEPDRTIVIGSNLWQSPGTFPALRVPPHDPNIILSFHSYTPMLITHYRASWVGTAAYDGPVRYPGVTVDLEYAKSHYGAALVGAIWALGGFTECNRETIAKNILIAVKRAKELGLPLQCGEFGCLPTAGRDIRLQYYRDMISIFQQYNIAYASWDYHGGFSVVYDGTGQPDHELIPIITGKTVVQ